MTDPDPQGDSPNKWRGVYTWKEICVSLLLSLFPLMFCGGIVFPAQIVWYLSLGWAYFLFQTPANYSWNRETLLLGVVSFGVFIALIHVAGSRFGGIGWSWRRTAKLVTLSTAAFVVGIAFVSLTHLTLWTIRSEGALISDGREPVFRSMDRNNLKRFGIAQHIVHDIDGHFQTDDGEAEIASPPHSWQTHLLPHMEANDLHRRIDFSKPWFADENKPVFQTEVDLFTSPGDIPTTDPKTGYALTSYSANSRLLSISGKLTRDAITDGTSQTIMAGDIINNLPPWGKPGNFRDPALGISKSPHGFGSRFTGGAFFLMADGSVQWFGEGIAPEVIKALATPTGGESFKVEDVID
ncbi:MAG: hypothetical protein CMJ46_09415 [Planctomyces sp.]|nr:hypothetical protein [Planctomyces sp.]